MLSFVSVSFSVWSCLDETNLFSLSRVDLKLSLSSASLFSFLLVFSVTGNVFSVSFLAAGAALRLARVLWRSEGAPVIWP